MGVTIFAVLVALMLSLANCAHLQYHATDAGYYESATGVYRLIRATPVAIRDMWDSRRPDLKGLPVKAFTDWKKKEIWFWDEWGLEMEKDCVESYRAMIERNNLDVSSYAEWRAKKLWETW